MRAQIANRLYKDNFTTLKLLIKVKFIENFDVNLLILKGNKIALLCFAEGFRKTKVLLRIELSVYRQT